MLSLLPRNSVKKTSRAEDARPVEPLSAATIASIFDLHGRCAYSLAMMILANQRQAEAAVEEAFRSMQCDENATGQAGQHLRIRLLQLVYAAAIRRVVERPSYPSLHPAALIHALPPNERQALALCLHGVTCAALDAAERAPLGTSAMRLHRALSLVRQARSRTATPAPARLACTFENSGPSSESAA